MEKVFFEKIKNAALKALYVAGQIAIDFESAEIKHWYKSKSQPVTDADIEINLYLKKFFREHTPDYGWLSEESEDDKSRLKKKPFWCLDPIDGTRSFISGKPEYTISLALLIESQPILGMIYNPRTNEMFMAERENGAFCNKKKIKVSNKRKIDDCSIAISSSEQKKIQNHKILKELKTVKMGSIAYKIALVAKGEIDIALSFTRKSDWDLAAASLIIEEAGGIISKIDGSKINYNTEKLKISSVFASNQIIHSNLLSKI